MENLIIKIHSLLLKMYKLNFGIIFIQYIRELKKNSLE